MTSEVRRAFASLKTRVLAPFRVRTFVFEHTRVRVRSFPPLFEHQWCESVQDLVDKGGVVNLPAAEYVLYEAVNLRSNSSLRGAQRGSASTAFKSDNSGWGDE